jgi:hypothetical protein
MGFVLAENELAIGDDIEDSAVAGDQLGFHAQLSLDFSRQTGGFGFVISLGAIRDVNLHARLLAGDRDGAHCGDQSGRVRSGSTSSQQI